MRANGLLMNAALEGPEHAPAVTLNHLLAASLDMWRPQMTGLVGRFRLPRYDVRGHGGTEVPRPLSLRIWQRMSAHCRRVGIGNTHFVGLSMGRMIEQVAVAYPGQVDSLLLADALSACGKERIAAASGSHGMESLIEPTVARWFTEPFRNANPDIIDWIRGLIRAAPAAGFIGCCRAPMRLDLNDELAGVRVRAQIVVGRQDPTTHVAGAEVITNAIPNARLEIIEDAARISNIEQPDAFSAMLDAFLAEVT